MILTLCTACAAPLPDEPDDAVQCAECATRYCSERCERYDRRRGGHGKICGAIASGGGAEQYNADKRYADAVADAVEECEEDTEGQTCYICLEDGSEEGLVRMCACRGASGFAHVSCLARQARILVEEAEENNLGVKVFHEKWKRWHTCSLCEQRYHGAVYCALGWACWKTYLGRPEADQVHGMAMSLLGSGLSAAKHHEDALAIQEVELSMLRRIGAPESAILGTQGNLATAYQLLGRLEDALRLKRVVYRGVLQRYGEDSLEANTEALNLALALRKTGNNPEAKELLHARIPVAERSLGRENYVYFRLRWAYAKSLTDAADATFDDLVQAEALLDDTYTRFRRVMGDGHPETPRIRESLLIVREGLARARAS